MSITKSILKLDGVAAVNLEEPSAGDLKRLHDAYHEALSRIEELEKIMLSVAKALDGIKSSDEFVVVYWARDTLQVNAGDEQ